MRLKFFFLSACLIVSCGLSAGTLDFAYLEGFFDKGAYAYRLLRRETFLGVCAPGSPLALRHLEQEELHVQLLVWLKRKWLPVLLAVNPSLGIIIIRRRCIFTKTVISHVISKTAYNRL